MLEKKTYERPEVFELGRAETLTLGAYGCKEDGQDCQKIEQFVAF